MDKQKTINLERMTNGMKQQFVKTYDGKGKLCSNGAYMFGVSQNGSNARLFIKPDKDNGSQSVINHIDNIGVNTSFVVSCNNYTFSVEGGKVVNTPVSNGNDKDYAIKWGMAFNNATRLVASEAEFDGDILKRVKMIEEIMPAMFKIAKMMPSVKKNTEDELF